MTRPRKKTDRQSPPPQRDPTSHLQGWKIITDQVTPENRAYWESLFTLGNGLLGVRGAREEPAPNSGAMPMTLMAEVYDRPPRHPGEPHKFRRPSRLVCLPNALGVHVRNGSIPIVGPSVTPEQESWCLDMRKGTLTREAQYRTPSGRLTRIMSQRLVSQARPHIMAMRYAITPLNYSATLTVDSFLDGRSGYPDHLVQTRTIETGSANGTVWQSVRSLQSNIGMAVAARHLVQSNGTALPVDFIQLEEPDRIGTTVSFHARKGVTCVMEKIVSIHNDLHGDTPLPAALADLQSCPAFTALAREHTSAWAAYWRDSDIRLQGDRIVQTMARFFVFQLLQSASRHNVNLGLSASIPAKGLTGPGYNGHVFWDTEIYMLPFFSQQYPEIAESLLRYRHDRLDAATRHARQSGAAGARFPWESADTGLEECPKWLQRGSNYLRWKGGEQEIHISADVAMGYQQHIQTTGNSAQLHGQALDVAVGTARYWASIARQQKSARCVSYHIRRVIGPDEYHSGINNSVYTNAMAAWNLRWASERLQHFHKTHPAACRQFTRRHRVTSREIKNWLHIADHLVINFDPVTGLYEEFDGYFQHPRQQIKQPDVMLMLHLLPALSSRSILLRNFNRYYPVTLHDSSLSPPMHVLFSLDGGRPEKAYSYLQTSCEIDGIRRGHSTDDGLHSASCGAGWMAIVAGFGGVRVKSGYLAVSPVLPRHWQSLSFSILYLGLRLHFTITPRTLSIRAGKGPRSAPLDIAGHRIRIKPGATVRLTGNWRMPRPPPRPRPTGELRAVIFDLDGVIVSTDEYHYQAWQQLADAENIPFDRHINHLLRGVSRMESLDIVLQRASRTYSPARRHALAESKNAAYVELLKKLTSRDILPGVMRILDQLKERGFATAIGSSSKNAGAILERIGLSKAFDAVVSGIDIKRSKPDPEVFLLAAKRLGIPPRQCLVVEDASAGVEAAHAAGMRCLAVGAAANHPNASFSAPDLSDVDIIIKEITRGG